MSEGIGIIAFAFGVPWTIPSNYGIARMAYKLSSRFGNAPIYTQKDIRLPYSDLDLDVEYTKEEPGNPPPTLRIARDAIQWAKKRGITSIVVIAATPHLWRALRDTKQAVREGKLRISVYSHNWKGKDSWFSQESTQKRTRSWWNWWSREIILRLMPLWLYKIIAR